MRIAVSAVTGNSLEDSKFSLGISPQLLSLIIPKTCDAIYYVLQVKCMRVSKVEYIVGRRKRHDYGVLKAGELDSFPIASCRVEYIVGRRKRFDYGVLKAGELDSFPIASCRFPKSEGDSKRIAQEIKEKWNFDTCVSAIDGRHTNITKPPNSGRFSVVIMADVNVNYTFMMVHTDTNGRVSDYGALYHKKFYYQLVHGTLKLPGPVSPLNTNVTLPSFFVGDKAFQFPPNILKPYTRKKLKSKRTHICRNNGSDKLKLKLLSLENVRHISAMIPRQQRTVLLELCCVHWNIVVARAADWRMSGRLENERPTGE
ncbi:hypothetical protein PR048_004145 [Dryococelus australis]|uniref:DDE Tnp4 domain-containing protein n=1 Tax=Dryococelus australis TaxID=614101 RepID=A0ABQ9I4N1_9NEOP|nr:hypothetical protein PR048_004145 [Dryococelus australis]